MKKPTLQGRHLSPLPTGCERAAARFRPTSATRENTSRSARKTEARVTRAPRQPRKSARPSATAPNMVRKRGAFPQWRQIRQYLELGDKIVRAVADGQDPRLRLCVFQSDSPFKAWKRSSPASSEGQVFHPVCARTRNQRDGGLHHFGGTACAIVRIEPASRSRWQEVSVRRLLVSGAVAHRPIKAGEIVLNDARPFPAGEHPVTPTSRESPGRPSVPLHFPLLRPTDGGRHLKLGRR